MSIIGPDGELRRGRTLAWAAAVVLFLLALVWGARLYRAHTSGGAGTLQIQQERGSAGNREHWSATFTQLYQNIQADQSNIRLAARAAQSKDATPQDAINLEGTQQACDQDVADWNADLGNVLAVVPAGYPQTHLDSSAVCAADPDTTGFVNP